MFKKLAEYCKTWGPILVIITVAFNFYHDYRCSGERLDAVELKIIEYQKASELAKEAMTDVKLSLVKNTTTLGRLDKGVDELKCKVDELTKAMYSTPVVFSKIDKKSYTTEE